MSLHTKGYSEPEGVEGEDRLALLRHIKKLREVVEILLGEVQRLDPEFNWDWHGQNILEETKDLYSPP